MYDVSMLKSRVSYPVLLLSSKAGEGNFSVAQAIKGALEEENSSVHHLPIEEIVSVPLAKRHFERYQAACFHFPWVLHLVYRFPFNYLWDYIKESFFTSTDLVLLKNKIQELKARTVICTNHRACFWVSALKKSRLLDVSLWAFVTDYHINAGWRFLFWNMVNACYSPVDKRRLPRVVRRVYESIELPVRREFVNHSHATASRDNVLVIGGGWGLGPVYETVETLSGCFPGLAIYVVCGRNDPLYRKMHDAFSTRKNIYLYGWVPSIWLLFEQCASVITKPGAVCITEAFKTGKKIFLIKGLPVTEKHNALFALKNFDAAYFSPDAFRRWYSQY